MLNQKEINTCKHSKEDPLFKLGAFVTLFILVLISVGSFFRVEIIDHVRQEIITDYQTKNSNGISLSEEQIIENLSKDDKETLMILKFYYWPVVLLIPLFCFLLLLYFMGKKYGELRGSSVKLDKNQYPEVYELFVSMAKELGFKKIPELYLVNGNGALNAFATCVPGSRNFAAIYSDILERCLKDNDMASLKFVLGHELGHIKLNHVKWWYIFLTMWMNFPGVNYLFGFPLSRAREYGCDKIGEKLSQDSSGSGLMMLSAGKHGYKKIDIDAYMQEHFEKPSFWVWVANLHQNHGLIAWRIAAIRKKHQAGLLFRNKK